MATKSNKTTTFSDGPIREACVMRKRKKISQTNAPEFIDSLTFAHIRQ